MSDTKAGLRRCQIAVVVLLVGGLLGQSGCGPQDASTADSTTLGVFTPGNNNTIVAGTQTTTIIEGLTVSPSALQFGSDQNTLTFTLRNRTGEDVGFEINGGEEWMHVDPRVAVVANGGSVDVTVTIFRVLIPSGDANGSVQIQIPDREAVTIPITVGNAELPGTPGDSPSPNSNANTNTNSNNTPAAALNVSANSLDFSGTADAFSILVKNSGGGSMSYKAVGTAPWIHVQNDSGSSAGEFHPLRIYVDRRDLPVGNYSGFVDVAGAGRTHRVAVSMSVDTAVSSNQSAPQYTMAQTLLDFGDARTRMPALFRNDGAQPVAFRIARSAAWIGTSAIGGVNRGKGHLITVSVDRTGMTPGEYWGNVDLIFETGVVRTWIVRMEVPTSTPATSWVLSPTDLDLLGNVAEGTVTLRMRPTDAVGTYQAFSMVPWLSVTPDRGEVAGSPTIINVTADRSQLSAGNHDGHIIFVSNTGLTAELHVRVLKADSGDGSVAVPVWGPSDVRLDTMSFIEPGAPGHILPQSTGFDRSWWADTPYVHSTLDSGPSVNSPNYIRRTIQALEATNPACVYGTYISGTDCRKLADMNKYPTEMIPYESVTQSYFLAPYDNPSKRASIDLTNANARKQMADLIAAEALGRGVQAVFLDNMSHPALGGTRATWAQVCDYMNSIKTRLNYNGMRLTVNLACQPYDLAGADAALLATCVDGLNFEQPFHWVLVRSNPTNIATEIGVYRYWLDRGIHVSLMAAWSDIVYDQTRRFQEERVLAGMCMIIRRPGDSISVPRGYFETPPDWVNWPVSFGAPLGDYTISTPGPVVTRDFQHATISVDLGKSMDAAQAANAVTVVWH